MQVCLIKAQVKSGGGMHCEWWRTDRSVTDSFHRLEQILVFDNWKEHKPND